jgi:hypothetical protein
MQKPLSLPLVAPLPPNRIAQPLQDLHVEMASNSLPNELMVHQTVDVKECYEHHFVFGSDEA